MALSRFTTDNARCGYVPLFVRADALALGDRILVPTWDGTFAIETVECLELVGDDVIVNNSLTISRGNTFQIL